MRKHSIKVPVASKEVLSQPVIALALLALTIKREGLVEWIVGGDTHCGPKSELKYFPNSSAQYIPVKYSMSVTCAPMLDERGFLFDQAAVHTWMLRQAGKYTTLSCEALCIDTAKELLLKLQRDVPHCKVTELIFTLSPAPHGASITCKFGV